MLIYFDMDGVLADFEGQPKALERFKNEKGFFQKLRPIKNGIDFVNEIIELQGVDNLRILTSSPNEQADNDKRAWVRKHLPQLANKVITVRSGQAKAQFAKGNYLVDDYTENLKYWVDKGGFAYKVLNDYNGKTGTHKKIVEKVLNFKEK